MDSMIYGIFYHYGYKVIYSNSAGFRLHYYFLNLRLRYAVRSIIIYFTFTFTVTLFTSAPTVGGCDRSAS